MIENGIEVRINGKVQGVGFRPYVWQLAHALGLRGDVSNDGSGVIVHFWQEAATAQFLEQLPIQCPPLASIKAVKITPYHWDEAPTDFSIVHSGEGQMDTHIVPDAATCNACLTEINTPSDRRYHYPFINCTHCGPRFTIIEHIPYDRPYTSMKKFALCPVCQSEYDSPADRRFHAQPNACPECGPHVFLCDTSGQQIATHEAAITQAISAIKQGKIVAIKGIGGFHLACDACNATAVQTLRQRKSRPNKPLAVMMPDTHWLEQCVQTNHLTEDFSALVQLLRSAAAPIVLVQKKTPAEHNPLCENIAPNLHEVGVMLPANPLQHLVLQAAQTPLVMTSGNARGKPPALSNTQALQQLAGIADVWLMHNRDIVQRADDSVVRFTPTQSTPSAEILRRARGYVPDAMEAPEGFEQCAPLLALGADLKNSFCLLRDQNAVLSQHLGDLVDTDIQAQFKKTLALFQNIYQFEPQAIAIDAHPAYISHQLGQNMAKTLGIPAIEVFHHHAHITSCMAEHGHARHAGPVIGLALDGLGYGANQELWGGECLLVDYQHCQRLGGLPAVALPGGDLASRQPWRNLLAHLLAFVPHWQSYPEAKHIPAAPASVLERAIKQGINSPLASSTGRLFDAVAAALGIAPYSLSWEGEAACQLEALALSSPPVSAQDQRIYEQLMPMHNFTLDLAHFWTHWLPLNLPPAGKAYAFHVALAHGFAQLAKQATQQHMTKTVVLSGGVIHNALLHKLLCEQLKGHHVLSPSRLPAGDGGLALGQALIATTQFEGA